MAFSTLPVRFFVTGFDLGDYSDSVDTDQVDIVEVSEHEFIKAKGEITYERHTKSENGVSQICLTKSEF